MHCEGNSRAVQRGWGRDGQGVVVAVYLLFCSRSEGGTVELGGGVVVVEEHQIRSREESRGILMEKILAFFLLQAQGRTDSELELKRVRKRTDGWRTDGFLKGGGGQTMSKTMAVCCLPGSANLGRGDKENGTSWTSKNAK